MKYFLHLFCFCLCSASFASPIPMTGSSKAVSPFWGLFHSSQGFSVDGRKTGWEIAEGPASNDNVLAIFKGPATDKDRNPLFTVRVDEDKKNQKPEQYVRSWLLLYRRLGLDVLGHQPFTQNGNKGFVIDVLNPGQNMQTRQALFFRGEKVVVLTCNDQKSTFNKSLVACNQLIKSFQWDQGPTDLSIRK